MEGDPQFAVTPQDRCLCGIPLVHLILVLIAVIGQVSAQSSGFDA